MKITKVQSVILDLGNSSPIRDKVKREIGPIKIIESKENSFVDLTDGQHDFGRKFTIEQTRKMNEANGFRNILVRVVRREQG